MCYRKYHSMNILNQINEKHGIKINCKNRQKIYNIFSLIEKVLPEVNGNRKRLISINYILCKLLEMQGLNYEDIKEPISMKTLKYYDQWWNDVYGLIKDDPQKL